MRHASIAQRHTPRAEVPAMMADLVNQFVGSGLGQQCMQQLTNQGLTNDQARKAVEATAGAANQAGGQSLLGSLGGKPGGGLPTQIVDQICTEVANRTGLDAGKAKMAVNAVLPKMMEFVQ